VNLPEALNQLAFEKRQEPTYVVQVGSCDGESQDPLSAMVKEHQWHGLFIEPLAINYARLQKYYAGCAGLKFAQCAVGETDGFMEMLSFPDELMETYASTRMLGTLEPRVMRKLLNYDPSARQHLIKRRVAVRTLRGLLAEHQVAAIEVLHIDTEGYDYKVLKQLDFSQFQPWIIGYESCHLEAPEAGAAVSLLEEQGYKIEDEGNTICATRF
jgi:FkbM family methyltransferase